MNILFFSPTGGNAGIDVCLDNLVSNLDRTKYNPVVILPKDAYLIKRFTEKQVKCYELPLEWWFPIGVTDRDLSTILLRMKDSISRIRDIIRIENIDLVFSNTTVSFDAACAALLENKKHVFYMHAMFVDNIYLGLSHELKDSLYRFLGRSSDKVICCSEILCRKMRCYCENACEITNGIDINKFQYHKINQTNKLNIVCVGHMNANKQQCFVLKALKILKDNDPIAFEHVYFTAIGPAEMEYLKKLKNMTREYQIAEHVSFMEFEPNIEKRLNDYNLYINSSITETLPLSVMEAMASGLPVLCTKNDGNSQIVRSGIDGFFCETPKDMAEYMGWILQHPDEIKEMGRNARERIEEAFTLKAYLEKFEKVFDELDNEEYSIDRTFQELFGKLFKVLSGENKEDRIRVLTVYPPEASATYTIAAEQPLQYLEEQKKVENQFVPLDELKEESIDRCDLVFCIRCYHDAAYELLKKARMKEKAFVWYIDDNYNAIRFENGKANHVENRNPLYEGMFEESDCVIVNNKQIYEIGRRLNNCVFHLPTYQTITKHDFPSTKRENVIRFGFIGTLNRDDDFAVLENALKKILIKYKNKVEIEFIGYCPASMQNNERVRHFEFMYNYREFRDFFEEREWDFALAPLRDTQFNRSKTNNKYREYSSFRIPAVFSKVSVYTDCVTDRVNGLLVDDVEEEWINAIEQMIEDDELRKRIGENAYNDIIHHYGIERYADPLYAVFRTAMRIKRKDLGKSALAFLTKHSEEENIVDKTKYLIRTATDLTVPNKAGRIGRILNFARQGSVDMVSLLGSSSYAEACAYVPGKKLKLSNVIPLHGYVEYKLNGIGNLVHFFLVSGKEDSCVVEFVEDEQIVLQTRVPANGWKKVCIPLGAIRGEISVRLKVDDPNAIVRTFEYFDWTQGKSALFGWIS